MSNTNRQRSNPCPACSYRRRSCPPYCESAKVFRHVYNRIDYHTIFSVFGIKEVEFFLQQVPDHKYKDTLDSFLFEATARIRNPAGGSAALFASLEQKVEALQSRVTSLEARLDGESGRRPPSILPPSPSSLSGRRRHRSTEKQPEISPPPLPGRRRQRFASLSGIVAPPISFPRANPPGSFGFPSSSFENPLEHGVLPPAHPPSSFDFPSTSFENPLEHGVLPLAHPPGSLASPSTSFENPIEHGVLPLAHPPGSAASPSGSLADSLEHPHYKSFLNLLMSTPDICLPSVDPSEHEAPLTTVEYPTLSDYQVAIFSGESSHIPPAAAVAETMSPDWNAIFNLGADDNPNPSPLLSMSPDWNEILNFDADDSQNPPPFI